MELEQLDQIRINFDESQLWLLNLCIALIMFGVSLQLERTDFNEIKRNPRSVIIGLSSQLLLLPVLTLAIIWIFQLPLSVSLGMILVSSCPGGNISNFASSWSYGNATLSVTLTSIITVSATFITPISFFILSNLLPHDFISSELISLDFWKMIQTVFIILVIPLILGITMQRLYPQFVNKLKRPMSFISVIIMIIFILVALRNNFEYIWQTASALLWLVVLHNSIGLLGGYLFSRSLGRNKYDSKAISLETGVQNAGLALVLIFNFFPHLGGMMIIAAWWGIWNIFSALLLSTYWRYQYKEA